MSVRMKERERERERKKELDAEIIIQVERHDGKKKKIKENKKGEVAQVGGEQKNENRR